MSGGDPTSDTIWLKQPVYVCRYVTPEGRRIMDKVLAYDGCMDAVLVVQQIEGSGRETVLMSHLSEPEQLRVKRAVRLSLGESQRLS